jgi:coenzyme F420 hydrogenase subunit beta
VAERWRHTWPDLAADVVKAELCTGCSGCVVACPQKVLDLDHETWTPQLDGGAWLNGDPDQCLYGERGCTLCARACPRFRDWETEADIDMWSRPRTANEVIGVYRRLLLVEASDPHIADKGQDGGLGTALLLYAIENDYIDAALVSYFDEGQRPTPGLARTREELLASAGSRYTYSSNLLALPQSDDPRLGLISVGCQTSVPPVARTRGARKLAKRFALVVGLLCSKTFADTIYDELLKARYGIDRDLITKVNIKGRLQVWHTDNGGESLYDEIPLKECRDWTRPGCLHCPDFGAEHADLSLGGIGKYPGKTIVVSRSELAEELLNRMESDGWITVMDATEEDPDSVALVNKLARLQRRRWPESAAAFGAPGVPPESS